LSIDAWKQLGGRQSPLEQRRHHIADAVFYPGAHPDNKSWTGADGSGMTLGADGGTQVVLRPSSVELGASDASPPSNFALKGTAFDTASASLAVEWNTFQTALSTFLSALGTYATGIQPHADPGMPPGPNTGLLLTAIDTFTTATSLFGTQINAYQSAVDAAVSAIVKVA
jgi:hypothetical protein